MATLQAMTDELDLEAAREWLALAEPSDYEDMADYEADLRWAQELISRPLDRAKMGD